MNLKLDPYGNIALDAYFPEIRRRTLQVSPDGGFFDHKDFLTAARRSRPGDCILIPTGAFATRNFAKSLEVAALHGSQATLVPERGILTLSSDALFFRGITFGTEDAPIKISITRGLVVFMDCRVFGEVEVIGPATEIALSRSALSGGEIGLHLKKGAAACLHSTAFTAFQIGIQADEGSFLDIRYSRFANCQSASAETPAMGLHTAGSELKITGARFIDNDIGAQLRSPQRTEILHTAFRGQNAAGLLIEGISPTEKVLLQNCRFQKQSSASQAQLTASNVHVELENCEFLSSPTVGIHAAGAVLHLVSCRFDANESPGLVTQQTTLTAGHTQFESTGVAVEMHAGEAHFNKCLLTGDVLENDNKVSWQTSPNFKDCQSLSEGRATESGQEPLNSFLTQFEALAGLTTVKLQVEQLLRELQGLLLCRQAGQPVTLAPYRFFMAGDIGSGRSAVTQLLIQAFLKYGILTQGQTIQCSFHDLIGYDEQGLRLLAESVRGGVLLIRRGSQPIPLLSEQQRRIIPDRGLKLKRLNDLIGTSAVIIVHGDRTLLRQLSAADEPLRQIFRLFYDFPTYTAAELAAIVIELCRLHQIQLSDECTLKLNVGFHVTHDRKDRRYQNATGAEELFQACQTRYLERISHSGVIDRQLLPEDIVFPYDRAIAEILTSSPGFVSKCPHCDTLQPWQVGLPDRLLCGGCGKFFKPETGTWLGRNSQPPPDEEPPQPEPRQRFTHRRIADIT